jgi:DNA-binding NtrC family response regulator
MDSLKDRFAAKTASREAPCQLGVRNFSLMERKSPALRVLVVEDELLIRWSVAESLKQAGHAVVEASDGASAIEALTAAAAPVDVVLLDFRLPDSNDLTLLSTIRRLAPTSAVVLMTAYGTPEVTQGALQLGVCRVLSKPFDMRDLVPVVLQAYGSRPASR